MAGRACSRAVGRGVESALLPLPQPFRGWAGAARGLGARIWTSLAHWAHRPAQLVCAPGPLLAPRTPRGARVPANLRARHGLGGDVDAWARPERADEHRPGAAGTSGAARALSARPLPIRGRHQ